MQIRQTFEKDGFLVVPNVLEASECDRSTAHVGASYGSSAGSRAMLEHGWCSALAESLKDQAALRPLLPTDAVAVQCTLFDKSPDKNWLVALHQDLSIPVARRVESAECSGWSVKEEQA